MHLLRIVLITILPGTVLAQDRVVTVLPLGANDTTITIDRQDCARLVTSNVPSADYKPGVDVNGRPVVPADLPSNGASLPESFLIDIKRAGALPAGLGGSDLYVGRVSVDPLSGKVELNGRPLPNSVETVLAAECARLTRPGG